MDSFFDAISLFRRRKYDECIDICSSLLQNNGSHTGAWQLKMRAMIQRVYVDDIEADDGVVGIYKIILKNVIMKNIEKENLDYNNNSNITCVCENDNGYACARYIIKRS